MILKSNSLPKIFMKKFIIFVSLPMKLETLLFVIDCLKTKSATSSLLPKPNGNGGSFLIPSSSAIFSFSLTSSKSSFFSLSVKFTESWKPVLKEPGATVLISIPNKLNS